ncbi:M28 family peptidase [Falsiroseomonas selenitidurans]|uniref:M28 family peptidase n=1 Tax=Falsiroseomonas selenitidurans TaxID=2716335 RepID=A0ABX1DYU4_9PROT|nr:M28 family peptidase [Falsiroseomonas selenitidurans]NKC30079.1 M28 family peptidase [Falsiroseomonas selenitidurans]
MDAFERRMLDQVTLDAPWELVETFARTPRCMPEEVNRGAAMIAARLEALGVPVTLHRPEIYLAVPLSASVSAGGVTYRAKTPTSSLPVPQGRTAPLVYLSANPKALRSYARDITALFGGTIASEEEARAKVQGKILLTEGFGNPALASLVEEWGGVGVIAANPGVDVHWGTCTTIWGTPDLDDLPRKPKIPMATVNRDSGLALRAVAAAGGSATITTDLMEGFVEQAIPVVEIPAADGSPDFVLLHGHYDSWDVGVGDNATGNATLLEIARVLWANRAQLKRGVRIAWWAGHSTGRYAGSTWYADAFALELEAHCVAQINCDSPGCRWATSFHEIATMSETRDLVRRAILDVAPDAEFGSARPMQAGDYSFSNIGISSFFMLSSTMPETLRAEKGYYDVSGCGGNIAWHTENDTIEIADRDMLLRDIRIYLLSVLRVTQPEVLPFDVVATAEEFAGTVARYAAAAGGQADLAPSIAATAAFRDAVARLQTGDVPPARRNAVAVALARILVPLNFTRGPRFTHDPAFTAPPLPCLAVAADLARMPGEKLGFARTQMLRGQNRYVSAMRAATRLVEEALD